MSKSATMATVDDGNVSVNHAAMVVIDGGVVPINDSGGVVFSESADAERTRVAVATVVPVAAAKIELAQTMNINDERLTVFLFAHDAVQYDGPQPAEN
jgi:hypothetical protein